MTDNEGAPVGAPPTNQDLGIPGLEDAVEIGRGGFGVVYRARQPHFNRTVAVKVLTQATLDETGRIRFERERQALGTISSHPNIVTVFDSGYTSNGYPYLVMEHLQSGSLAERIQRDGAMGWEEAVALTVKVAGALSTVHAAGILHRDIKPENILISAYGEPHLGDFGIARILTGPETKTAGVTTSVAHAAPEILGGGAPSVSSDVYALTSTLFTLIDGHPAFFRDTDETVVTLIGRISLEPVPDLRPRSVPDAVCEVIEHGMAKEQGDRQASAEEFGRQLQDAQRAAGATATAMLLEPPAPSEAAGEATEEGLVEELALAGAVTDPEEGSLVSEADETRALSGVTPQPPGAQQPPGAPPPPPGAPEPTAPQPPATPQPPAQPPGVPGPPPGGVAPPPPGVPPAAPVGTAGGPPSGGGGVPKWVLFVVPAAVIALIVGVLVVAGGGDDGDKKEKKEKTVKVGGETSIDDVKLATVQIIANGSFVDPEFGETESSGAGTGFIIDPEGIAVTNNHVVTGAASLEVKVPGETKPKNAKVLGVSECADLAVIDIDGGGYTAVKWSDKEIKTGLEVNAFGYPLGDPEITQTKGIISKASAAGDTQWASVDGALEHDAKINPGNSGGPLVLDDGSVVGVNFATGGAFTEFESVQYFAIGVEYAQEIVEQLRKGKNVDSIGVNGQAVFDEASGTTGVWAASVDSGSAADKAGIEGGDIITRLENITIAEDGTMKSYCDVIRSHDPTDALGVEILRYSTSEVLKGQINGDPLELSFSFAEEVGGGLAGGDSYIDYVEVTSEGGELSFEVPVEWSDVDDTPTDLGDGVFAPSVLASTDIVGFNNYDAPGAGMILVEDTGGDPAGGVGVFLDEVATVFAVDCATSEGRSDYDDGLYLGSYDTYTGCGTSGSQLLLLAAYDPADDFLVLVVVNALSTADLEALDNVLSTFLVL